MALRLVVAIVAVFAGQAFADSKGTTASPGTPASKGTPAGDAATTPHPMQFHPHGVKDAAATKKGVDALASSVEAAWESGDMNAVAALIDFPVQMVTDDSQGQAKDITVNKEQFLKMMSGMNTPKDVKVTHKHKYDLLTDSLALIEDDATITMGGKKIAFHSADLAVKKDGTWKVKSMVEGGHGDDMGPPPAGSTGAGTQ